MRPYKLLRLRQLQPRQVLLFRLFTQAARLLSQQVLQKYRLWYLVAVAVVQWGLAVKAGLGPHIYQV